MTIDAVMRLGRVIPVIVIADAAAAVPLATRLVAGGMAALEVTLRTPAALDAIRAMAEVPGAMVGAGTVLNEAQLDAAIAAGAKFIVAPGLTERLARAAIERDIPLSCPASRPPPTLCAASISGSIASSSSPRSPAAASRRSRH